MGRRTWTSVIAWCGLMIAARTAAAQTSTEDLKRMSLQDLLTVEVTTVSRQPEPTNLVPAAVFVITNEDIRRSGATSIPEALRLAPGLVVARINAGVWSIGIRGFADRLSRSMLVLIDGRPVYSPLFAGTYWEVQDTLLADIDRIEVIRGPGGTLWGANAVNGIINIITKAARDTQGVRATVSAGNQLAGAGGFRYGGTTSDGRLQYRVYGKGTNRDAEFHANGNNYDGLRTAQGGFRGDLALDGHRTLTVQGDVYNARLGELSTTTAFAPPFSTSSPFEAPLSGGNVLAKLAGPSGDKADFQLQAFYDRTNRREIPVGENRDTIDLDFQRNERRWSTHTLTWGLGYRVTTDRIDATAPSQFSPARRSDNLFSLFAQDDIALTPGVRVDLGAKLEHNAYSGFEIQPSVRVSYAPDAAHFLWGSVTRAVRTPSQVETDYTTSALLSAAAPTFVRLLPNPQFQPEELVAYEAGYRLTPPGPAYVTFSSFYNHLGNTLSTEVLTPFVETTPGVPHVIIPVEFENGLHGTSYGAEVTADIRPTNWWRWTTNYSYLQVAMSRNAGSHDVQEGNYEGMSPRHQVQLGSSIDLPGRWSVDWMMRYASELTAWPVPAHTSNDLRVAWSPVPNLEVSIVGQDLNDAHHLEWISSGGNVEIRRSAYAKVTWTR